MFQVELTLYSQLCFAVSILKKSCPRPDLSPVRAPGLLRKLSISSQEIWSFASIHWTLSVIAVPHFKCWSSQNIFSFPDLSLTPSLLMAAAVSSWQLQQQKQRPSAGCLISGKNSYYSSIVNFNISLDYHHDDKHICACPVPIGQLPDFCFICPGPRPRFCPSNEGMN